MDGLSIIICTYNPDHSIFQRVLSAIKSNLLPSNLDVECIVVDNNSTIPVEEAEYVRRTLAGIPKGRVVLEKVQGLASSRKRGIREATNDYLLFVDDDNELAPDYLQQLAEVVGRYPFIGAINAGVINVEYVGAVNSWFTTRGKVHFQDSSLSQTIWGNDSRSFRHWPFGTGLMVRRDVAEYYIRQTESGRFSLADRTGKLLTSGGDGQLVACALELGYGVGRAKELKLNHIIASRKATISYLTRQDYGIYFSDEIFMKECYPDSFRAFSPCREIYILLKLFSLDLFSFALRGDVRRYLITVAATVGRLNGKRVANGKRLPLITGILEGLITGR